MLSRFCFIQISKGVSMIYNFIKFGAFVAIVALFSACSRSVLVTPSGATNFDGEIYKDMYNYRLQRIDFNFGSSGSLTINPCDVIIDHLTLTVGSRFFGSRYTQYVLIATSKQCNQNNNTEIVFSIGETVKYTNNSGKVSIGVLEQVVDENYVIINDGGSKVKIHTSKLLKK
jgi:hypothetical protein